MLGSVIASVGACSRAARDEGCTPAQFGYSESFLNRPVVEAAATKANAVLSGTDLVAWPSWAAKPPAKRLVPLFIVDESNLPRTDLAFSPNGKTCLFINRGFLARFLELFGAESPTTFDVAPDDALAIVLLHELGHFHNGDAGAYSPPTPITPEDLPVALSNAKNTELRADKFAGEQLGAAASATDRRLLAVTPLIFALTHITWNLEKVRLIENLGATELGVRSVVGDAGYSHPNLELRFLIIAYVSAPPGQKARALQLIGTLLDSRGRGSTLLWSHTP